MITARAAKQSAVGLMTFSLIGCATLFSGTKENISINSNPPGATILIDGLEMGRTPATIPITRPGISGGKTVVLRMDGYEDRTFVLQSTFNAISLINILFWPGFVVDALTGAITKYSPTTYTVTMEQSRREMAREMGVDHVVFVSELPTDLSGNFIVPEGAEGLKIAVVDPLTRQAVVLK